MANQAVGAANGSVNKELRLFRRAFSLAAQQRRVSRGHVPEFQLLPELNVREGFEEAADFAKILAALTDLDVRDFVTFAFRTGMRKGAIQSLSWSAYDKETATLRLAAKHDKARKGVWLALEGELLQIVKRRVAVRHLDCPLIFHRDGKPITSFRKAWKTATRKAGVPNLLVHDLRRSAVRNMTRAGVNGRWRSGSADTGRMPCSSATISG